MNVRNYGVMEIFSTPVLNTTCSQLWLVLKAPWRDNAECKLVKTVQ